MISGPAAERQRSHRVRSWRGSQPSGAQHRHGQGRKAPGRTRSQAALHQRSLRFGPRYQKENVILSNVKQL